MGKFETIRRKLLDHKAILTYQELEYFLVKLGYAEKKTGKTSGSRVAFVHIDLQHIIRIHKPLPGNEIKKYVKNQLIKELNNIQLL
jgi:hypothetical protein